MGAFLVPHDGRSPGALDSGDRFLVGKERTAVGALRTRTGEHRCSGGPGMAHPEGRARDEGRRAAAEKLLQEPDATVVDEWQPADQGADQGADGDGEHC